MAATQPRARHQPPTRIDEAAVRAMSPEEYMNDAQRDFFRHLLQSRLASLGYTSALAVNEIFEEQPIESGDRAFIEEERAIATSLNEHTNAQRAEIDRALGRIEEGTYGYCEETGDPIGIARLLAYPAALYTVEVQERHERAQRLGESSVRSAAGAPADSDDSAEPRA